MLKNLWSKVSAVLIPLVWIGAIAVRWWGSYHIAAQPYDIGTYEAWGHLMIGRGPAEFFATSWSDYLPLPIYLCAMMVKINDFLHMNFGVLFKLTVSLIELSLLAGIWSQVKGVKTRIISILLIVSPALIGDSAFWGQLDTIPSLLTLLSLLLLKYKPQNTQYSIRFTLYSAFLFGLAVAFKPIVLITLPVFLILLLQSNRSTPSIPHTLYSILHALYPLFIFSIVSFVIFILPALPVSHNPLQFVIDKSLEQASTYPYTTINGWNLWSVVDLHNSWPPDSASVFGLSAHNLGLILFTGAFLRLFYLWYRRKWDPSFALRLAGSLLVCFYVVTTRMHERHLLFGLPFLALAVADETWLIIPSILYTLTFILNLWGAYYWVNHGQIWPIAEVWIRTISWVNVLTAFSLVYIDDAKKILSSIIYHLSSKKLLIAIIVLASFLRMYHLSYPADYIFDEVYHSFTAREYIHNNVAAWEWWTTPPPGVAYEWTHPPVAKYGMVVGMLLFGENSFGWRIGSAVMGVICIMGVYALTKAVFKREDVALLSAFLVSIEGLHISQSRVGMNDMYMLCFLVWSLYNAVKGKWKISAVLYGLSLGSKWSAMYGVVPLAFIYLHQNWKQFNSLRNTLYHILHTLRLLLIVIIVYTLTFIPFFQAGHTWAQWWELHRQMWYYHTHLVATHAYQSTPKEWIFSLRPVWYYVHYGTKISNIYAQGNPMVLWLGLVALLSLVPNIFSFSIALCLMLYAIFTVPWLFSPRIMFFYHYLPSATFLCIILAYWLTQLPRITRILLIGLCIATLILMSPVYFGFAMPQAYWDALFKLFPSWK